MALFKIQPSGKRVLVWAAAAAAMCVGVAPPAPAHGRPRPGAPSAAAEAALWDTYTLMLSGPSLDEASDTPNPFLDFRLQVKFKAPSGKVHDVPGFFDGNGSGSGVGTAWKVRFSPDEMGSWTYTVSFRQGNDIAVSLDPGAGSPAYFDGQTGGFAVGPPAPGAPGFLARGRLQYVGEHHLRFQDGTYFLKTGTDSPENFFGYAGFDNVDDIGGSTWIIHTYGPHVGDWQPGDPQTGAAGSPSGLKGIVGALNYLSEEGVNAIYFLPMNLGGDGQETSPFLLYEKTAYAKTHYDVSRLEQWNTVLQHAMRRGIQAQLVLSETETDNEKWLDDGQLGVERKLFFRELVARFGHNLAIKWNLGEENDFSVSLLGSMATYLAAVDPYDHPISVHTHPNDFTDYEQLLGNPLFSMTSIQYTVTDAGEHVEEWRTKSAEAGHPWVLDMDENGTPDEGVSDQNAPEFRKEVLYEVLFSGGCVEWYLGSHDLPVGGDHTVEDFRTREPMWTYSRIARELLEDEFQFWRMQPADHLLSGESGAYGGGEVFALQNRDYAIYMPDASASGTLDLSGSPGGLFWVRWFDPRQGQFKGSFTLLEGGAPRWLGTAPSSPGEDWVVVVKRVSLAGDIYELSASAPKVQNLKLDAGPDHAFDKYLILSTISGVYPGTDILGLVLPLNWDAVTSLVYTNPEAPGLTGFAGVLDAQGRASAQLDLSGLPLSTLVGVSVNHAFLAGPGALPTFASNATPLEIVP